MPALTERLILSAVCESPRVDVAVIGLGLIGGSVLRALAAAGHRVTRLRRRPGDPGTGPTAERPAAVAGTRSREALAEAELVVLAVPLARPACRPRRAGTGYDGLVTDVTSVKGPVRDLVDASTATTGRFVGGHPMAGKETSGFAAADPALFDGCAWVLCLEPDDTVPDRLARAGRVWSPRWARASCRSPRPSTTGRWPRSATCRTCSPPRWRSAWPTIRWRRALAAGSFRDGTRVAATRAELTAAMCGGNADRGGAPRSTPLIDDLEHDARRAGRRPTRSRALRPAAAAGPIAAAAGLAARRRAGRAARPTSRRCSSSAGPAAGSPRSRDDDRVRPSSANAAGNWPQLPPSVGVDATNTRPKETAMPGQVGPITNEQEGLLGYLAQMRYVLRLTAYGLTDGAAAGHPERERAQRRRPDQALRLHRGGLARPPSGRSRSRSTTRRYADNFRLADGETIDDVFARYDRVAEETEKTVAELGDLDHAIPIDHSVPWNRKDMTHWTVRWILLHLIQETARHTGHADIIRETIDGGTAYPLMAAAEGWPETAVAQALEAGRLEPVLAAVEADHPAVRHDRGDQVVRGHVEGRVAPRPAPRRDLGRAAVLDLTSRAGAACPWSTVDSGATTTNGRPARRAPSACAYVPILLTTSPLAQIRSAPRITASTSPRAIRNGPAESTATRYSMPHRASSHAVSRAPCSSGRVSLATTPASVPRRCSSPTTPRAVPTVTAASAAGVAVGQQPRPVAAQLDHQVGAARRHRRRRGDLLVADRARLGQHRVRPVGSSAAARRAPRARFTAVGRACLHQAYGRGQRRRIVGVQPGGQRHPERTRRRRARARRVPPASGSPRPAPPPCAAAASAAHPAAPSDR